MEHPNRLRGLKPLVLCSAAIVAIAGQPSFAQERPGAQDRPAASQPQDPKANKPSARDDSGRAAQDRTQRRENTGQGSAAPSASDSPAGGQPRATQERDSKRDAQSPAQSTQDRQQSQSRDGERDRDTKQSRDSERTQQRDQARDRDSDRDRKRDQARDRDSDRDRKRDQARERDSDRDRNRDQARDRDQRQDRDNARQDRSNERNARDNQRRGNDRQAARPTDQQRTRITTSIRQANVQPVRNVNFSVSVGTVIPATVRFYPVTPAIVEIYPQYRGYSFVLVDEEIVIIEPRTRKIVQVIEYGGGGSASVSRSRLSLSDKERDMIRRHATERRTTGSARVTTIEREYVIGDDLPEAVEIEAFPETIYTEIPEIRSYRYVVRDRDIYVVDPTERRVIEIIR